jgi:hypothetical protein
MDNNSIKKNKVNITPNCIYYTNEDGTNNIPLAHISFKNLEKKHVEIVSQNGGHILEIGFGLGCSANEFVNSNTLSYTCIEINQDIHQYAMDWAQDKPNVNIIHGAWEDIIPTLTLKYEGIYYGSSFVNYALFYNMCKSICKIGTIISIQGYAFELSPNDANIESDIPEPHFYDGVFTKDIYNSLIEKQYYKVYWNVFNGIDYVKYLEK